MLSIFPGSFFYGLCTPSFSYVPKVLRGPDPFLFPFPVALYPRIRRSSHRDFLS